jgi:hypothetical protein
MWLIDRATLTDPQPEGALFASNWPLFIFASLSLTFNAVQSVPHPIFLTSLNMGLVPSEYEIVRAQNMKKVNSLLSFIRLVLTEYGRTRRF